MTEIFENIRKIYTFAAPCEELAEHIELYDSLGDYYVAKGDKAMAIQAFSKSLTLQVTADTRRKLNQLLTKK